LNEVIITHREKNTKIEPGKIKKWSIEILEGLDFLHSIEIVHFDIKPDNILVEQLNRVKIGDLGLARHFNQITANVGCTPCYASPQIITGENINEKTDIW
jgi:serine/threonine protein kinase